MRVEAESRRCMERRLRIYSAVKHGRIDIGYDANAIGYQMVESCCNVNTFCGGTLHPKCSSTKSIVENEMIILS